MKVSDFKKISLHQTLASKPKAKEKIADVLIATGQQFVQAGQALKEGVDNSITIGDVVALLADLSIAITAVTPNKADDAIAIMSRALLKQINK